MTLDITDQLQAATQQAIDQAQAADSRAQLIRQSFRDGTFDGLLAREAAEAKKKVTDGIPDYDSSAKPDDPTGGLDPDAPGGPTGPVHREGAQGVDRHPNGS